MIGNWQLLSSSPFGVITSKEKDVNNSLHQKGEMLDKFCSFGGMGNLNPKQQRFCEEYIIDLNGSAAAIRAGYSKKTARQIASEYLTKPNILSYIQKLKEKRSQRTEITADMVVRELAKIGFSNVQDYIESGNLIQDLSKIDSKQAAAVSSIKKSVTHFGSEKTEGTKEVIEFKLWDKVAALEKIGRHLGIFEKDNAQTKQDIVIKQNVIKLADGTEISI